jgi:DNA repair protein RadC
LEENNTSFTIKEWSEEDRPREKLQRKGCSALSDAELLAILICSGNRNESAVTLSKRILSEVENNLHELGKLTINDFKRFNGVGTVKAITIIAALEIGRRRRSEEALVRKKITSSHSVFELMQPIIGELPHEEFWILYLNNSNKVLELSQLSKGGITGTLVDIRLALKNALQLGAVALVLAHNHPSGTLKPSKSDLDLTKKLKRGGENLDIKVLDHLIITENAYFSFADSSLL